MSEKLYAKIKEEGQYVIDAYVPDITFNEIGKRGVTRRDGIAKASGKALYTRDIFLHGMIYGRIMFSPYPRAKIISMDTSAAEKMPGVRLILRYDDPEIEGRLLNGSYFGPEWVCPELAGWGLKPIRPLLGDEAWYEGQPLGLAVFADSEEEADEAIRLTKVEWKQLPFVLDQEEALKEGAPILRPGFDHNILDDPRLEFDQGDVEKGFKEADRVIEYTVRRNAHAWAGAEMPSVVARWHGDNLELWIHQQQPYHAKQLLSEFFKIPMNKIVMHTVYQGCAFGGRGNPGNNSENGMNSLAVIAAARTGKPVKVLYDRRETFFGMSGDAEIGYFKVGCKTDGTITAVEMKNIFAVYMCTPGHQHIVENTRVPNVRVRNIVADVSKPPAWWCRCEQLPNCLAQTVMFDKVAGELGMDPTEVALKNDGCEGHDMSYLEKFKKEHGYPPIDSLKECIKAGKEAMDWDAKWHAPGAGKLPNGKLHGMSFTWTHNWDSARGHASAAVMFEDDGTVSILGQHSDIGPNPWTAYCQIAADELGMESKDINVRPFTSESGFALMSPDGSCNLCANGLAIRKACKKARGMLLELAATKFDGEGEVAPEDLDIRGKYIFMKNKPEVKKTIKEVVALAMPAHNSCGYWPEAPIIGWAWTQQGLWGEAMSTGRPRLLRQAHFMEIEVDPETGGVEVTKIVNVNDVGKVISPETVEGQVYGGDYSGIGRALTEELVWDKRTGVLLNRNLLDYKYPTMLDCGEIKPIIKESGMGYGPYGASGIGEHTPTVVPAMMAAAVYNATGKWVLEYPLTPARILKALSE